MAWNDDICDECGHITDNWSEYSTPEWRICIICGKCPSCGPDTGPGDGWRELAALIEEAEAK